MAVFLLGRRIHDARDMPRLGQDESPLSADAILTMPWKLSFRLRCGRVSQATAKTGSRTSETCSRSPPSARTRPWRTRFCWHRPAQVLHRHLARQVGRVAIPEHAGRTPAAAHPSCSCAPPGRRSDPWPADTRRSSTCSSCRDYPLGVDLPLDRIDEIIVEKRRELALLGEIVSVVKNVADFTRLCPRLAFSARVSASVRARPRNRPTRVDLLFAGDLADRVDGLEIPPPRCRFRTPVSA